MTRTGIGFMLGLMLTVSQASAQYYNVLLEPDTAKRRSVPIEPGPTYATLRLYTRTPWTIRDSRIVLQADDGLWVGPDAGATEHIYRMARGGQSSLEFVQIEGHVVRPGQGDSPPPWFRATVPSVDVDWEGHSAKADEEGEFDRSILLPLTTDEAQHKVVLIQTPKDDSGLVRPDLKIEWQPADGSFRVWEGGTQWQSGRVIDSRQVASWPVRLRVEPLAAVSDLIIKVTGTADENGSKATDAIRGKIVNVDLDVDADNDGTIGDADDPLEETPGGLLATGTLKRIGLKMEPAWVTGTLKLTAEAGGSRIRVWRDAGKSVPLALPAEWTFTGMGSAVPSSLYVEGLSASSAARDVQLRLRFTDDEGQTLDDSVRLTVVKVENIEPNAMFNLQELDDGDDNVMTRVFVIPIANALEVPAVSVTVRSIIVPSLSEGELPSNWTLQGGDGIGKLSRTIGRTVLAGASKSEFTFTFGGADSGLRTTVYVYEASVTLYADQGDMQNIDVGHSWGRFDLDAYIRELVPQDSRQYLQEVGFWPSISGSGNCVGDVRLGTGAVGCHVPSGLNNHSVLFSSLSVALSQVKASDDNPPWYHLFNYNCTDYAIGFGQIVNFYTMDPDGVSTPWAFSSWLNTH